MYKNIIKTLALLLIVPAIISGCGLSKTWDKEEKLEMKKTWKRIAILGDSISAGVNPDGGLFGWVHMLIGDEPPAENKQYVDGIVEPLSKLLPDADLQNYAMSGLQAYQLNDFGFAPMKEALEYKPDLAIICIGGNDFLFRYSGDGKVSSDEMRELEENISGIMDKLRGVNPNTDILLIGYYDLFDGNAAKLPQAYSNYRAMSEAVTGANKLLAGLAERYKAHYIDLEPLFLHHAYGAEFGDRESSPEAYVARPVSAFDVHPNNKGHEVIANAVYAELEKWMAGKS